MKKFLLTAVLSAATSLAVFSQAVPNGGFESWTTTNFPVLQSFPLQNPNIRSLQAFGQLVTTQVADPYHGSFAVKLETKGGPFDTIGGYFINGQPDPMQPTGGTPYSQQPTGMTGHYKCNVPLGDTAIIVVMFKKNGLAMANGTYLKKFTGVKSSYTSFSFPFSISTAPDSVIIGAAASNLATGNFKGIPGSMFQLDSIRFTGVASQPAGIDGSFETWNTRTYNSPDWWRAKGDSVNRSVNSYTNTYALTLQVVDYGNYVEPDQVTTGYWTKNGTVGGYPYNLQNDSLIGYYKMNSVNNDTARIYFQGSKLHVPVGGYNRDLPATSVYKRISMPINFSQAADTLRIDITACKWPTNPAWAGSKLWIDGLHLLSQPLGVQTLYMGEQYFSAYPNPSNGVFNLLYDSESSEPVHLTVYNEIGQQVYAESLKGNGFKNPIDLSSLKKGFYLLRAEQNGKQSTKRIIIE